LREREFKGAGSWGRNTGESGIYVGAGAKIAEDPRSAGRYTSVMSDAGFTFDEFQALEQKVLRAVEIVKREREARAAAEAELETLRAQLAAQSSATDAQVAALNRERDEIRQRVESMIAQMDELL
jgi:chromosome segregation ATPase